MDARKTTAAIFEAIKNRSNDAIITVDSIADDVMMDLALDPDDYSLVHGASDAILKLMFEPSGSPEEMLEHAKQLEEWSRQRFDRKN